MKLWTQNVRKLSQLVHKQIHVGAYLISRKLVLELFHLGFCVMDDALSRVDSLHTVLCTITCCYRDALLNGHT